MKYSMIAAPLALVAGASAWKNETYYTTEVVTSYETYCPYATTFSFGKTVYTVTEATTLTILDCPCTITKPVVPFYTQAHATGSAVYVAPVHTVPAPIAAETVVPVSTIVNGKVVYLTSVPVAGVAAPTAAAVAPSATPSAFTGAGSKVAVSAGSALAAICGLAAFFL